LPLWHHFGEDPNKLQQNNTPACKCLRENHGVIFIADGLAILNRTRDLTHKRSPACKCGECRNDRRQKGCNNPHACVLAVEHKLNQLLPKWDPREVLDPDEIASNKDPGTFCAPPPITAIADGFRVFTNTPAKPVDATPLERAREMASSQDTALTLYSGSATKRSGGGRMVTGAGLWLSRENEHNLSIRIPENLPQT
ncbi:hypothetical protein C8R43DRAFT_835646, partial [Mycena crocata]